MAIQTVNPTVNTTPDIGGTSAVSSISNTGHGSTVTLASAVDFGPGGPNSQTVEKSAKWSSFSNFPAGTINSLHLKLNWDIEGDVSAETSGEVSLAAADLTMLIEHSLNGGSSWSTSVVKAINASASGGLSDSDSINESGAVDVTLLTSQVISQVQVRILLTSNASASAPSGQSATASASHTVIITDIKLEADITPAAPASSVANRVLSAIM